MWNESCCPAEIQFVPGLAGWSLDKRWSGYYMHGYTVKVTKFTVRVFNRSQCITMLLIAIFSLSVFFNVILLLSILYLPVEVEEPLNADKPRKHADKMTHSDTCLFYLRELIAPEHVMQRRVFFLCCGLLISTTTIVLHFSNGVDREIDLYASSMFHTGNISNMNISNV